MPAKYIGVIIVVVVVVVVVIMVMLSLKYKKQDIDITTPEPLQQFPSTMIPVATTTSIPPLFKFPPHTLAPDNNNVSGMTEGNGTYLIKSSFDDSSSFYKFFDGNTMYGSSGFFTSKKTYNPADGSYTGGTTTIDTKGDIYNGEWYDFYLPVSVVLKYIYIYRMWGSNQPSDIAILGSNDKNNWIKLSEKKTIGYGEISTNPLIFRANVDVDADQPYMFYRMVVMRVGHPWKDSYNGSDGVGIAEIELYGHS